MEIQKYSDEQNEIIANIVIHGDLSKLSTNDKSTYYKALCERLGLDPLTQPFKLLKLSGKEILYCDRSGAQQLNRKYNISHSIVSRENLKDIYLVVARASMPDGRHTESIGAVSLTANGKSISGDALCNALMKAETKAKRRSTLDLVGLGFLDESEIETIPEAKTIEFKPNENKLDVKQINTLFDKLKADNNLDWKSVDDYVNFIAAQSKSSNLKILEKAVKNPEGFLSNYNKWLQEFTVNYSNQSESVKLSLDRIKALNASINDLGLNRSTIKKKMREVEMIKNDGRGRCKPFDVDSTKDILDDDFISFMDWMEREQDNLK